MSAHHDVDAVVIGAGVVGLAVASELCRAGLSVFTLERNPGPGRETSSRNSEVIHSGIYYPTRSLKARLCVGGNRLLYAFCEDHGVEHRAVGKLIVACTTEEIPELERLFRLGQANGVEGLELLGERAIRSLEPNILAVAGIWSPLTGIIDSHGLIKVLEGKANSGEGRVFYSCHVTGIERTSRGYTTRLENPSGEEQLHSRLVVNAAGLEADHVAALAGIQGYRLHWCKGDYFAISGAGAVQVKHLIYPVPSSKLTSLGIHITLDLANQMRLGPDMTYIERGISDYSIDSAKAENFYSSVKPFLPGLDPDNIHPYLAGIRPKVQGPDDEWQDFVIKEETSLGRPGLVNLVGIESPGLTACLAIALEVHDLLKNYI